MKSSSPRADALVARWRRLRPAARVAAFRELDAASAARAFELLPPDGKWLAYLGSLSDGAAPLRRTPAPSAALRARMRKALAR